MGQDGAKNPATIDDALNYKQGQGYPDDMDVVLDPNWSKLQAKVKTGGALPYFIVLGNLAEILYTGADISAVESIMVETLEY
jgi:hypothetical protein